MENENVRFLAHDALRSKERLCVPPAKLKVPKPTLVQAKSGLWMVSYTCPIKGYTKKYSTGTRDRKEAEARRKVIELEITSPVRGTAYTVGELLTAYMVERAGENVDNIDHALAPLRDYFAAFKADQLNDRTWTAYRKWRTAQQVKSALAKNVKFKTRYVADSTAVKELNIMRAAVNWGGRNGWRGLENVRIHIKNAPQTARHDWLTREEAKALIKACVEPHTCLFVRLALATGARMSAVLGLTWDNITWPSGRNVPHDASDLLAVNVVEHPETQTIDYDMKEMHVRDAEVTFDLAMAAGLRIDLGRGRGNKRRGTGVIAPNNTPLYDALLEAYNRRRSEHVIEWRAGGIDKITLTAAYRRAGLAHKKQKNHILKHTCCSWLIQDGESLERIAALIGTSPQTIWKHYGHLSVQHLETVGASLTVHA